MFRIADLDYLDYAKNPEKGVKDIVETVKRYLFEKQEQERKRKEEIERAKKRELLEKEIKEIKSKIDDFELKTSELEVVRKKLIIEIERLPDETAKKQLTEIVNRNKNLDSKELVVKDKIIADLKDTIEGLDKEIVELNISYNTKLDNKDKRILELEREILEVSDRLRDLEEISVEQEKINKEQIKGYINNHEYVDLGLPSGLKWASCNVGASKPEEYGDYFAWGEITTKKEYTEENSVTYGERMRDISGNAQYDVARAIWGGTWRMPTKSECQELIDKCTWQLTTQNGVEGSKVIGPNGNSIFLPAAGSRFGSSLNLAGSYGYYWSSTPNDSYRAFSHSFSNGYEDVYWGNNRYGGLTVRPITE